MTDAWDVLRAALRDTWNDLLTTALCNLLWVFFSLLVVTAPPATLALFYVGNRIARGEPTDPGDFLRGVRHYFGVGWRWGLLHGFMLFFLVGDVILTGRKRPPYDCAGPSAGTMTVSVGSKRARRVNASMISGTGSAACTAKARGRTLLFL